MWRSLLNRYIMQAERMALPLHTFRPFLIQSSCRLDMQTDRFTHSLRFMFFNFRHPSLPASPPMTICLACAPSEHIVPKRMRCTTAILFDGQLFNIYVHSSCNYTLDDFSAQSHHNFYLDQHSTRKQDNDAHSMNLFGMPQGPFAFYLNATRWNICGCIRTWLSRHPSISARGTFWLTRDSYKLFFAPKFAPDKILPGSITNFWLA